MRARVVIVVAGLAALTCRGRDETQGGEPAPRPAVVDAAGDAASVAGAADAAPVRGGPDDPMAEKQRHCPLTVGEARTTVHDVEGGIELLVEAAPEVDVVEIRRRAAYLVELAAGRVDRSAHGGGEGGGNLRNCPVVVKDTQITVVDVNGGSRIIVQPAGPLTVEDLRTETRRRFDALHAP